MPFFLSLLFISMNAYHTPVLLSESIDALNIQPQGTYADVTFGGGGHSRAILQKLGEKGRLIAFDQDENAMSNLMQDARFHFFNHNFRYAYNFLKIQKLLPLDGILADLGISSHQIDTQERGFSTRFAQSALDMRMNTKAEVTAQTILNTYTEEKLAEIFYQYGELKAARKIAAVIVKSRVTQNITTVKDLQTILQPFYLPHKAASFFAQVFQALRIEVNQELEALCELLRNLPKMLQKNGRVVIISYHSLEDRLVKNMLKTGNLEGVLEKDFYGNVLKPFALLQSKVIVPSALEIAQNPRARSAKMRVAIRL